MEEVEFEGACAFCDLSSGFWGWCLHCERIYPATIWRANNWFCPAAECDGGPADVYPFPSTPRCENCLPPLDSLPVELSEGQSIRLWPPPSPLQRKLLSSPLVWIRQQMGEKKLTG